MLIANSKRYFAILAALTVLALCLSACPSGTPNPPNDPNDPNPPDPPNPPGMTQVEMLEQQTFDLVNLERTNRGLGPLTIDPTMRQVARAHSQSMVTNGFFEHVDPVNNTDPLQRINAAGVTFTLLAENIALANNGGPPTVNSTPPTAVSGWMASNGHRKNILNGAFGRTGMGVAVSSAGDVLFTQEFAD